MQHQSFFTILFSAFLLLAGGIIHAQTGLLKGRVSDSTNTPVAGATVTVIMVNQSTITDSLGLYQLTLPAGNHTLMITVAGFKTVMEEVEILENQPMTVNLLLANEAKLLDQVIIQLPGKTGTINTMLRHQKNTASIAQVLSAEAMGKTPDNSTNHALKRVTGLSIQDDKYLNVRGLGDRYNQTMLNGMLLSSTEPDRKTFSFDLFPTAIIDNIIIDKTFLPEYSGEWAGGLVIIETKDIPNNDFLNLKAGTGFNSKTIGKPLYKSSGARTGLLGFPKESTNLPAGMPGRKSFATLSQSEKNGWGKQVAAGDWSLEKERNPLAALNQSVELNGGVHGKLLNKEAGGIFTVLYNHGRVAGDYVNRFYNIAGTKADESFDYSNQKYAENTTLGALANISLRLHKNHTLRFRNQFHSQTQAMVTLREGRDYEANSVTGEAIKALEHGLKVTNFYTGQLSGEHLLPATKTKLDWYGSFGIMDQKIPNQLRIQYNDVENTGRWTALLSNTLSQKTGSIFFSHLNDYLFNSGIKLKQDLSVRSLRQTIKAGYNVQVKDRLYNSRPFGIRIERENTTLLQTDPQHIFNPENFDRPDGFEFDELSGLYYQYTANSLLHAGFLQIENNLSRVFNATWGMRIEHQDQVTGSKNPADPRYTQKVSTDWLPAMNITAKLNSQTNLRAAVSRTVIRPEFRELTGLAFYDFELGAAVIGNPNLKSTRVTNFDLRYEVYPKSGELITAGIFYKHFQHPIELAYNQTGAGSSSTFNYLDNAGSTANTYGAEVELRKSLAFIPSLKNFMFQGNFSVMASNIEFETKQLNRAMQGQSPWLINAGLLYESAETGWSVSLLFNKFGRRIIYVGNETVPAIWEAPRPLLDAQISKSVLKRKGKITLNMTDILASTARFYHDLDQNKKYNPQDALVIQRTQGSQTGISFHYQIK